MRPNALIFSLCAAGAAAVCLYSTPAQACGGTFCDAGPPVDPGQPPPPPMPVDQTGETVIFAVDGDMIEAHIQIEFDPNSGAERFAWLIPLPAVPEFGVSSDAFFDAMLEGTTPVFAYSSQIDQCGSGGSSGGSSGSSGSSGGWGGSSGGSGADDGCGGLWTGAETTASSSSGEATSGWGESGDGAWEGDDDSGQSGAPEVVQHGFAGAFEYYTLDGGTVDGVMTWLEDNQFDPNPDAEPIVEDYLASGHVFVAVKLQTGDGVSAIHPIRLRFTGDEFCVPLRLTQIAAVEDMAVRVMVLGEARAAPSNWAHVVPNPVAFDWINVGANYDEVMIMAVDSPGADGHAWVTQYAGTSTVVDGSGLVDPAWELEAFAEATPETVVDLMRAQGMLGSCGPEHAAGCEAPHVLAMSVLEKHLPVPEGVDAGDFYACVECYAGLIDPDAFDAAALMATIDERIIEPAQHAQGLLEEHPALTRLLTRISPWEMTEDPTFWTNPELPLNVGLPGTQQRTTNCSLQTEFVLDYLMSIDVGLINPNLWPSFTGMPWALRVEQVPAVGAPQVLVDNEPAIRSRVESQAPAPDTQTSPRAALAGNSCADRRQGCGCDSSGPGGGGLAGLAWFALWARRRRRRA